MTRMGRGEGRVVGGGVAKEHEESGILAEKSQNGLRRESKRHPNEAAVRATEPPL